MPNSYAACVDVRRFLNFPGFLGRRSRRRAHGAPRRTRHEGGLAAPSLTWMYGAFRSLEPEGRYEPAPRYN